VLSELASGRAEVRSVNTGDSRRPINSPSPTSAAR
jgi:hypothetical protein